MSLALPWSDLDHVSQLAQADQDWACQGKLALAQPGPDLAGRGLDLALSSSGPACLGLGCDRPGRALTLYGLAMLDLNWA